MTVIVCPAGCGGIINTEVSQECSSCRLPTNEQRVKVDPDWCWEWFGPYHHRMKCRRRKGHGGEHHDHSDDDDFDVSTYAHRHFDYELGSDRQLHPIAERKRSS